MQPGDPEKSSDPNAPQAGPLAGFNPSPTSQTTNPAITQEQQEAQVQAEARRLIDAELGRQPSGANDTGSRKTLIIKIVAIAVIVLATFGYAVLKSYNTAQTNVAINISDLVDENIGNMRYKRPKTFGQPADKSGFDALWTVSGKTYDRSPINIAVTNQTDPSLQDYETLSQAQRDDYLYDYSTTSYKALLEDKTQEVHCDEAQDVRVERIKGVNYTDFVQYSAYCKRTDALSYHINGAVGVVKKSVHSITISTDQSQYSRNQQAIQEIITTFKPAE